LAWKQGLQVSGRESGHGYVTADVEDLCPLQRFPIDIRGAEITIGAAAVQIPAVLSRTLRITVAEVG